MSKLQIFNDKESLAKFAADLFVELSAKSIERSGKFTVALSGGSTPLQLFRLLSSEEYSGKITWKRIFIFWGDERMVPATNKDNNSFQARQALLDHVNIPPENIFPVPVHYEPHKAAEIYSTTLLSIFKTDLPEFDLILLGLGDDGHTASLFPGDDALFNNSNLVTKVEIQGQPFSRISFTLKLINEAKNIVFMVTGPSKKIALKYVLEKNKKTPDILPAMLVKPKKNSVLYWLADKEAAALISINQN